MKMRLRASPVRYVGPSRLNWYLSITIGFGLLGSGSSAGGSRRTMASRVASGDHVYDVTPPLSCVSWRASPPERSSTHTCVPFAAPGRDDRNEISRPSGLQRGDVSFSVAV